MRDGRPGPSGTRRALLSLLFAAGMIAGGGARAASGAMDFLGGPVGEHTLCTRSIAAAEAARQIPQYLLQAIASVESGRWSAAEKVNLAWPWTVYAEGRGRYLPSKAAAIAEVEALLRRGVRNIDVGCMQVNLHYHGRAFSSLEEAFDPVHNVAYATSFLVDLRRTTRSWTNAVKSYHSRTRSLHVPYRKRVYRAWRELRQRARAALR